MARRSIPEDEMLWPLSMPPQLPTKDEEIKIAKLDQYDAVLYRRYLAKSMANENKWSAEFILILNMTKP